MTKNPFKILTIEHYPILQVASALAAMKTTHEIDPETLKEAISFIRNFADRYHHEKEEKVVFERTKKKKVDYSPIEAMEKEHEMTRGVVKQAAKALEEGKIEDAIVNLRNWANFIPNHIERENFVLFPGLDNIFNEEEKEEILREFERVDEELGSLEEMETLANKLFLEIVSKSGNAIVEARAIPKESRDDFILKLAHALPKNATLTVLYDEKSEELEKRLDSFEIEEIKKKGVYAFKIKRREDKN